MLDQLQFYLMKKGKPKTGNKKDLVACALIAFESKDPVMDSAPVIFLSDLTEITTVFQVDV